MSPTTSATGIAWDLRDLYQRYDDPAIKADIDRAAAEAEAFATTYRGTINVPGGPDAQHLLQALQHLESIYDTLTQPGVYASLLFAADTSQPAHRNLQQWVEQRSTAVKNTLLFFNLEWLQLPDDAAQHLIDHPALHTYRHYLQASRRYQPHTLTEPEERIVNEKDLTGAQAWQMFFTELLASLTFPMQREGKEQRLDLASVLTLMRDPERATRQQAFTTLYATLGTQVQSFAFIYNTLLQDHLTMHQLRHYADPMAPRHLSNTIDPAAVTTMMEVVEQNYDIAHTYFTLKARLLGLPRLQLYDQYAPVGAGQSHLPYPQAKEIVLDAFSRFDERFHDIAATFFQRNWIDAEVRPGKQGGAFCSGHPPSKHPYILCNYTDHLRDVMTLAHELGHGIHFYLARKQTFLNFEPSIPVAETASVFGEMLVFEQMLNQEQNEQSRLALICNRIEDTFSTIFRQNVLTRFEQAAFAARAQGRLTPEQLGDCWLESNRPYYGEAVEQTSGYELGWSYIPHFIYTPFYCYGYVFGELLVLALYSMYREQGAAFTPRYIQLLESAGSRAPADMLADLGVDIHDPAFWQRGFTELRRLVALVQELASRR